MSDMVNHPPHYADSGVICPGCGRPVECIEITRHLNFNLGNAVKYIWRAGSKGDPVEDLEKAEWYLNDELRRIRCGGMTAYCEMDVFGECACGNRLQYIDSKWRQSERNCAFNAIMFSVFSDKERDAIYNIKTAIAFVRKGADKFREEAESEAK